MLSVRPPKERGAQGVQYEGCSVMPLTLMSEFIDALKGAADVESIHDICSQFSIVHEFDHFLYGARVPTSFTKPSYIYVSAYPEEWRSRYAENGYIVIDPTVSYCAHSNLPLDWAQIPEVTFKDQRVKLFMGEAAEFGLRSGASVPVHTPRGEFAMFNVASQCKAISSHQKNIADINLFSNYLHESIRKIFMAMPGSVPVLTDRERQCLLWAAEGKTAWETAQILNVSERTVVFHVQNAAEKLNVANRQQAVARAVLNGLITPQFS